MKLTTILVQFAAVITVVYCNQVAAEDIVKKDDASQEAGALSALAIISQLGAISGTGPVPTDTNIPVPTGNGGGIGATPTKAATTVAATQAATGNAVGGAYSYDWANSPSFTLTTGVLATSADTTAKATGGSSPSTSSSSSSSGSSSGLWGIITGFLGNLIESINFESIAGYIDELLTSGNNIQYLDDILIWLKDTNLLPQAAKLLLSLNISSPIITSVLSEGINIISTLNTTTFFVALDKSGLAYSVIADAIEDSATIPGVFAIISDVIKNGGISISDILSAVGRLVKRDQIGASGINEDGSINLEYITVRELAQLQYKEALAREAREESFSKRQIELESVFQDSIEEFTALGLTKRDNIEDLLVTILSSVERSGLINATLHSLLIDPAFQQEAADLISGALKSLVSGSGSTVNLSAFGPILSGLVQSGLLLSIFTQALNDPNLRAAIINDIGSLLSSGTATLSNFYSQKEIDAYYRALAQDAASIGNGSSTLSTVVSSATASGASVVASASASASGSGSSASSKAAGSSIHNSNILAVIAGLSGYVILV